MFCNEKAARNQNEIGCAAGLTSANLADNKVAPALIYELPPEVWFIIGDAQYNTLKVREVGEQLDGVAGLTFETEVFTSSSCHASTLREWACQHINQSFNELRGEHTVFISMNGIEFSNRQPHKLWACDKHT